jgi:D-glycero-D-manno-heptose 1,7-bisphosphate phosphatase
VGVGEVKAVFLDRDGVLNEALVHEGKPVAPSRLEDFKVYPQTAGALARLKSAGFLLIVVTNQPDVARGEVARETVEAINARLRSELPMLDDVFVCWHDDPDNCPCRKPRPGMLLDAAAKYGIDLAASFLVGDRWRDIDAGANAGVHTVLIDRHWPERGPDHPPDFRVAGIAEATDVILNTVRVP